MSAMNLAQAAGVPVPPPKRVQPGRKAKTQSQASGKVQVVGLGQKMVIDHVVPGNPKGVGSTKNIPVADPAVRQAAFASAEAAYMQLQQLIGHPSALHNTELSKKAAIGELWRTYGMFYKQLRIAATGKPKLDAAGRYFGLRKELVRMIKQKTVELGQDAAESSSTANAIDEKIDNEMDSLISGFGTFGVAGK